MRLFLPSSSLLVTLILCLCLTVSFADPGIQDKQAEISDQKAGTMLIYNVYTSNPTNPTLQNTRINLTNSDDTNAVAVHLFFVDGDSCSVADNYVCLSRSQTVSLMTSELDPGINGYVIALAVDARSGRPIVFNKLIGDEYVKFASGHSANLPAIAVATVSENSLETFPVSQAGESAAILLFDGTRLDRLPRVLAASNIPSRLDGNDTMLIVNRIGGDLRTSAASIGGLFGLLFDELETPYSFSISNLGCQVRRSLTNDFPRTVPRLNNILSPGMSGWMKFWSPFASTDPIVGATDIALTGASINYSPFTATSGSLFNSGHNLHQLTKARDIALIVPLFPANCGDSGVR